MYGYSKDAIHVSWNDPEASYGKPYSHYAIYLRETTYDESAQTYETGAWKLAMEILATRLFEGQKLEKLSQFRTFCHIL